MHSSVRAGALRLSVYLYTSPSDVVLCRAACALARLHTRALPYACTPPHTHSHARTTRTRPPAPHDGRKSCARPCATLHTPSYRRNKLMCRHKLLTNSWTLLTPSSSSSSSSSSSTYHVKSERERTRGKKQTMFWCGSPCVQATLSFPPSVTCRACPHARRAGVLGHFNKFNSPPAVPVPRLTPCNSSSKVQVGNDKQTNK